MVLRFESGKRASNVSVAAGVAHMAITPNKPYDASLGVGEQTRQLVAKLDAKLAMLGLTKSDVIFVQLIVADMADLIEVNTAWDEWIDPLSPPTRACIAAALADPAMRVEFIVQADASKCGAPSV